MREITLPPASPTRSGRDRIDISVRNRREERMDSPDLDPAEHLRALGGLARINAIRRTARHVWREIRRGVGERPDRPLRILDAACGAAT